MRAQKGASKVAGDSLNRTIRIMIDGLINKVCVAVTHQFLSVRITLKLLSLVT